jgi:ABC-2 type transport system ATP-binding protein
VYACRNAQAEALESDQPHAVPRAEHRAAARRGPPDMRESGGSGRRAIDACYLRISSCPFVEIQNVTKTFGAKVAVDDLSLMVPEGTVYGLIGPNGSGKSTTIRMIMRIYHPDAGQHPRARQQRDRRRRRQRPHRLPAGGARPLPQDAHRRGAAVLRRAQGRARRAPRGARLARAAGLAEYEKKRVESLSKGMAQKIQFIATVLHRPRLVILDEPFSGLDP